MKKRILAAMLLACVFLFCIPVSAEVISTKAPTAGDAIYIAGNPDLYPLEYYDEKNECYKGILPNIYEKVSEETGLRFSYVGAGSRDRQKELAENLQVEIVSVYHKGDVPVSKETELFSYAQDGTPYTVCIGFTKITEPGVAAAIEAAIQKTDKSTWLAAAMELEEGADSQALALWLVVAVGALVAALTLSAVYILKKRQKRIAQDQTKMTDPMTGIGNTNYFANCYAHHISEVMRPIFYVAYIAIDIEKIETYFGTPQSEELQRYAAATITDAMRDTDFAARIDNGVFALCFMCPDKERAAQTAETLISNLNAYNKGYAEENGVLFRCGLYPLDKQSIPFETVIYNARQGYLHAINTKQQVCLCDKAVLDRVSLKSRLQKKITAALENKEFKIYLQFVVDTKDGRICGAEVLSRWHSRDEGVLSPANYIDDMRLAGIIDKLDFYIIEQVCQMLSQWKGTALDKLYLSCNFTRSTLSMPQFSQTFQEILSKYDFNRKNLVVELTEDSLVDDSAVAYRNILAIKKLGCRIALDDFGQGYTSFRDLCDYPLDVIKVDRHIVAKAAIRRGYAVLTGVIRMAHDLGIGVLCEGVETESENARVVEAGCDYIQGFYYSRVLPAENAMEHYKNKYM